MDKQNCSLTLFSLSFFRNLEVDQAAPTSAETTSSAPQNPEKETQTSIEIDGDLVDEPPEQTTPAAINSSTTNGHGTVSERFNSGYMDGARVMRIGLAPLYSISEADLLLEP